MSTFSRNEETNKLDEFLNSNRPEFLAIYGRRRVGKTFLIKNYFASKKCVFLAITGIEDGTFLEQRTECIKQIANVFYDGIKIETPKSWFGIFELLTKAIENIKKNKKVILFLDEFPWLMTPRSRLLQALEYYWNQYWSNDKKIKLIICGSLASWIIKNIINNTGGLYNRVTYRIKLEPFNLYETKMFLKNKGINLTNQHILSIYMVTGGIPFYLEQIKKGLSANQVIDNICFNKNGILVNELEGLFKSLFSDSKMYITIIREIAKHRYGIGKSELAKKLKLLQSGRLNDRLKDLEDTGFIVSFLPYHHIQKGGYYRVIDEYTMFYFRWIEPNIRSIESFGKAKGFWLDHAQGSSYKSWCGYTFESICYKHTVQIITALKLKVSSLAYTWRSLSKKGSNDHGAQIDLLFNRSDDAITVCEIKYTDEPFGIDKKYAEILKQKIDIFRKITQTKKQIFLSMISANGIKNTMYSEEMINGVVTIDDLFKKDV